MSDLRPAKTLGQLVKVSPLMADLQPANTTLGQLGKGFPLMADLQPTNTSGSAG